MFEPTRHDVPKVGRRRHDWWRGAVIYQVYPRSFQDTDGDGVGDLPGITRRLEHIADLGADAVWISPFTKSPQKDYGYDVADYTAVDPLFGSMDDFDSLLETAHGLNLKVLVDFVASHTSSRHPWFLESREDRTNPKADWYVWVDPKPDGSPPNNWLSVFGGPSWEWEPRRRQYYLHNFLKEQPDLDFHNPEVIGALLEAAEFWLKRGVDGFRLDAIDFGVHDLLLRDNPARPQEAMGRGADLASSPYGMQYQLYSKARPELADLFFKPLWHLTEKYDHRMVLAEIAGDTALERMADYTDGGGIDMAYSFDLLTAVPTAQGIRAVIEVLEEKIGDGWACWSFGNHDVRRAVSRFRDHYGAAPEAMRLLIPVLLTSLRGTICLYQGEELGLEEADLPFEQLHDPWGITFWPRYRGRDGCRTPMPWEGAAHAGFSTATPWLPAPAEQVERSVESQTGQPGSTLEGVRRFLSWRRTRPELSRGHIRFIDEGAHVLAFWRERDGSRLRCLFNLSNHEAFVTAGGDTAYASAGAHAGGGEVTLPPWGFIFLGTIREGAT